MAGKKPDYKVFVSREGQDKEGADKNYYTEVGAAWKVGQGAISIQLNENIAVSNKLVCFVNEPKEEKKD